jgi:hypothetical protein
VLDTSTSPGNACCDSRSDVHGDPADLAVHQLAFTGVQARANLEPERLDP